MPMGYDIDVFVSYAHIDDQVLGEGQTGWISSFHRALEVRLAQLLGQQPKVWRDPKLQGNDVFADTLLAEKLPRAALLVTVLSPRYVRSEWCTRELREFLRASEKTGGVRVADKVRVFKVVKTPIPLDEHPAELQRVLGYDFFTVEPDTGRARELSQSAPPEAQRQYWARLDDLAHDIADLLKRLHSNGHGAAAGTLPEPDEKEPVFLAETSFDLRAERDALKREIQGQGLAVLPDQPLPLVGDELAATVREQLGRCRLSIHLIGRGYGVVPDGATESVVALQNELAIERGSAGGPGGAGADPATGGAGFTRLVWLPAGLETDDERQRKLIESLRTDARIQETGDLLETSLEDFKTVLVRHLRPPLEPAAGEPAEAGAAGGSAAAGDDLRRVYLVCDQRDLGEIGELEDLLFDRGFEVITPVFEGDEAQVRRDHEESLVACDAVLLYWGHGNDLWLRRKLREIQKSAGFGRKAPFRAKAIYLAPPDDPAKERLRTHEAAVLQGAGGFAPETFEPFFEQMR
jgi:hypothetical protein